MDVEGRFERSTTPPEAGVPDAAEPGVEVDDAAVEWSLSDGEPIEVSRGFSAGWLGVGAAAAAVVVGT